ncbi:hypothetical protein [Nocardia nova]|uniref:hypothetical protein n=1 Tax=Nocardia nova TaxID=37330 RepID=UPI003F77778F
MAMPTPDVSSMLQPMAARWTSADLARLPDNGIRYEVLNGQRIVNGAPKPRHQESLTWLPNPLTSAMPQDRMVKPIELVQRAAAGVAVTLHAPFEFTVDPKILLR